jgi:hypothetical protein
VNADLQAQTGPPFSPLLAPQPNPRATAPCFHPRSQPLSSASNALTLVGPVETDRQASTERGLVPHGALLALQPNPQSTASCLLLRTIPTAFERIEASTPVNSGCHPSIEPSQGPSLRRCWSHKPHHFPHPLPCESAGSWLLVSAPKPLR